MMRRIRSLLLALWLLPQAALAGSWAQINQPQTRPADWTPVPLAAPRALGEVTEPDADAGIAYRRIGYGDYPRLDGSTVAVPMAVEFARQHLGLSDADTVGFVSFSTTHQAYENLIARRPNGAPSLPSRGAVLDPDHPVDLIIATAPSADEQLTADEAGMTLLLQPVCYDAFVFITRADNPVDSLSLDQIRDIYAGRIDRWSDVGGPEAVIHAYEREPGSGSQTAMEQLVMQGEPMQPGRAPFYSIGDMSSLVDQIGSYENKPGALGYTYLYYLDALYRSEDIKVLAIDGVAPTPEAIRSGEYPLATHYYAVIRAEDRFAVGGQFADWMLSDEGQRCIAQAGYIPLRQVAP